MILYVAPKYDFTYEDVKCNIFHVNINEGLTKHQHTYNHITFCTAGACKVSLEGRSYIINKNSQPLGLPANEWHEIEAIENNTIFINIFKENK